jgi:hypothetical protein
MNAWDPEWVSEGKSVRFPAAPEENPAAKQHKIIFLTCAE